MSINYIIASHPGKIESRKLYSISPYVLSLQLLELKNIFKKKKEEGVKNHIEQITVVCTKPKTDEFYSEYYDSKVLDNIEGIPLKFVEYKGQNIDHSYDQWLQGIEAYPNFDYFILIEDDYCISRDNIHFDSQFVDIYKQKFNNDIGYLCSLVMENPFYHAAISNGFINKSTSEKISTHIYYDYEGKQNYSNNYPQLRFNEMMIKQQIPIEDASDIYYIPFFDSMFNKIINYSKKENVIPSFLPIQDTAYQNLANIDIKIIANVINKNLFNRV